MQSGLEVRKVYDTLKPMLEGLTDGKVGMAGVSAKHLDNGEYVAIPLHRGARSNVHRLGRSGCQV